MTSRCVDTLALSRTSPNASGISMASWVRLPFLARVRKSISESDFCPKFREPVSRTELSLEFKNKPANGVVLNKIPCLPYGQKVFSYWMFGMSQYLNSHVVGLHSTSRGRETHDEEMSLGVRQEHSRTVPNGQVFWREKSTFPFFIHGPFHSVHANGQFADWNLLHSQEGKKRWTVRTWSCQCYAQMALHCLKFLLLFLFSCFLAWRINYGALTLISHSTPKLMIFAPSPNTPKPRCCGESKIIASG